MMDWDARFDQDEYVFGEEPNTFLASQATRVRKHERALAVADGEGRNGVWLAEQGLEVTAIDASAVGLRKAHDLARRRGVSISTQAISLEDYDWPVEAFDLVVAIFIQFAGPDLRGAIFEGMLKTLAPGGILLMQGYRPEQIGYGTGGPSAAENLYTEDLLRRSFGGLQIIELRSHDGVVQEGLGHNGMSALIDLVAVKPAQA